MKSWKKQLKNEFDKAVPALRDEVRNAPILTAPETDGSAVQNGNLLVRRRLLGGSACFVLLLALAFALMGIFGVFRKQPDAPAFEKFVFGFEINPAAAFITDQNGKVLSVKALNADADILLSDTGVLDQIEGRPLPAALAAYTDSALKLGYLDLSAAQSAVRLSSSTEAGKNLMAGAADSLQTYFRTNGIYAAVVQNTLAVKDLCARLGVEETDDLAALTGSLESLSALAGERVSGDVDEQELQRLYKTYILGAPTLEWVRGELLDNIQKIVQNAQMLQKISFCALRIMTHKDNPCLLPADYWYIRKHYAPADYSEDFAGQMKEMEELLAKYQQTFGVEITGTEELKAAVEAYASLLDAEELKQLFTSLTLEDFQNSAPRYVAILKNIGFDVSALDRLLNVPSDWQAYTEKLRSVREELCRARTEQYKTVYQQPRTEISEDDYTAFINGLLKKYGSLEDFWNKK